MGTFIEIISTPTSYSIADETEATAVWSPLDAALDVTGYETIDIEVLVYGLVETASISYMTASTRADDTSLWSLVDAQDIDNGPTGTAAAVILRKTIGETSNQPLLRYLRWKLKGDASNPAKVLLTVRGIGRAG